MVHIRHTQEFVRFLDSDKIKGNRITYTFRTGIFGIRVVSKRECFRKIEYVSITLNGTFYTFFRYRISMDHFFLDLYLMNEP